MSDQLKTPVVLLIFNRYNLEKQVFNRIREARPEKLFVIADGPRSDHPDDAEKCQQARSIIEHIDWDCEVKTKFSDVNLGCAQNVSQGISWVFTQVEEAIILEDDCIPDPSFFRFHEELLEKYRFDTRIGMISGFNPLRNLPEDYPFSYYFTKYAMALGWSTWKRAWRLFNPEIVKDHNLKKDLIWKSLFSKTTEISYWKNIVASINKKDSWAYRWFFSLLLQNSLCIFPQKNMIKNIGYADGGTHTTRIHFWYTPPESKAICFPLSHPDYLLPLKYIEDKFSHEHYFSDIPCRQFVRSVLKILHL